MADVKMMFSVDEKTAARIERYWHNRRFNNRAEAIRQLVKQGLMELEDKDSDDPPTQKQIELVKKLCKEKKLEAPEKWSKKAYSGFIYHNTKKEEK